MTSGSTTTSSPTLVLVHGGSVTSLAWDPVLPLLHTPAVAIDLPGRRHRPADLGQVRRRDWEVSAAADIAAAGLTDVVLVGHSSGAYVIPGVAALLPPGSVRHLVFVAGTCPAEGDSPVDAMTDKLRAMALGNADNLRAQAAGKTLGGLRDGEPPIVTNLQVVGVDPRMGVEAPQQLFEPMTWPDLGDVPRTYVRGLRDRVIPPDHALVMARNARAGEVVDLDAEHDTPGTAPAALAAVLDRIADSAGPRA